jgi:hypothetical protein
MGKIFHTFAVGLIILAVSGCLSTGALQLTSIPNERFDNKGRIYLHSAAVDSSGIQDCIEYRLLKAGFDVKPGIFVKSGDKYIDMAKKGKSGAKDYKLQYDIHASRMFLINRLVIREFDASMIDLKSGKTVLEMKFQGRRSINSFTDLFMEKIIALRN